MSIAVQVHPDEYDVRFFPADETTAAFAVVRAHEDGGTASLFLSSPADCDELIKAAAEAKRLLLGEEGTFCPADTDAAAVVAEAIATGTPVLVEDDADCGCGCGAARCRELEDGGAS